MGEGREGRRGGRGEGGRWEEEGRWGAMVGEVAVGGGGGTVEMDIRMNHGTLSTVKL